MLQPRVFKVLRNKRGYSEKIQTAGDQIKTERLDRGLLQKKVARILGVETSTITGWERHYHLPHISHYPQIAKFLGNEPIQENLSRAYSEGGAIHSIT